MTGFISGTFTSTFFGFSFFNFCSLKLVTITCMPSDVNILLVLLIFSDIDLVNDCIFFLILK